MVLQDGGVDDITDYAFLYGSDIWNYANVSHVNKKDKLVKMKMKVD